MTSTRILKKEIQPKSKEPEIKDIVLEKYSTNGVYVRKISCAAWEIAALEQNATILKNKKIKKVEDLKKYCIDKKIPALGKFRFRPSTLIRKGLAIATFCTAGFGVIIDPEAPSTLATHFYKENAISGNIGTGLFSFSFQNSESHIGLLNRLERREKRRTGELWDKGNKMFGNPANNHDEILLTYYHDGVIGITLHHFSHVHEALKFRKSIQDKTKKVIHFYQYDKTPGALTRIPESVIDEYIKRNATTKPVVKDKEPPYPILPAQYIAALKDQPLENIKSSLNDHPPSKEHPIQYQFNVVDNQSHKKLKCAAFVESGVPLLSVNKSKFRDTFFITHKVVEANLSNQMDICNGLLKNKSLLNRLGVNHLSLTFNNRYLVLRYKPYSIRKHDYIKFLYTIGYVADQPKYNIMSSFREGIVIQLSHLQAIDTIVKQLTLLTESLHEEPMAKKRKYM